MPGIFDVSMILSENIPVYPGDPRLKIEEISNGDGSKLSKIAMGVHTGTHIDAPNHFFTDKLDISGLDLNTLVGKALVVEMPNLDFISLSDVEFLNLDGYSRILFKTDNSNLVMMRKFSEDYVYLTPEAADYLIKKGIDLIGFDYYTLDKYNSDMPVHKKLLENDVLIIEGLDLSEIEAGEYELIALPLKLKTEGAPARVILRKHFREEIPG